MNNNAPVIVNRGSLPVGNERVIVRNKQDMGAGVFRNKGVTKNYIPKAG